MENDQEKSLQADVSNLSTKANDPTDNLESNDSKETIEAAENENEREILKVDDSKVSRAEEIENVNAYLRTAEIEHATKYSTLPLDMFYKCQSVFVTGGTGFLGKFLIRELLQVCPGIECIYVLIRPKDQKSLKQRQDELIFSPVLKDLRLQYPEIREKIVGLEGDCTKPLLGLSPADMETIVKKVSIVYHLAGTAPVTVNEKLMTATRLDCQSTIEIGRLCKAMDNLRSLVYVSSAHSHYGVETVEERRYRHTTDYEKLSVFVDSLDEKVKDLISPGLASPWPNIHTYSKAMAEDLFAEIGQELPAGIFRIGLLSPSANEPSPGYCCCERTSAGSIIKLMANVMQGLTRTMIADGQKVVNLVPVDMAASALVTCAHDIALFSDPENKTAVVYNYVSSVDAPITWEKFQNYLIKYVNEYPYSGCPWPCIFQLTENKFVHDVYDFLYQRLAAVLTDVVLFLDCRETSTRAEAQEAKRFAEEFSVYALSPQSSYGNENVRKMWKVATDDEKKMCNFDLTNFNWERYVSDCVRGVREHVLRDPPSTLHDSRRRCRIFRIVYRLIQALFFCFVYYALRMVFFF